MRREDGAGYFLEQAMESCQYDFGAEWEASKVPEKHPDYESKLKKTGIRYNGKHIGIWFKVKKITLYIYWSTLNSISLNSTEWRVKLLFDYFKQLFFSYFICSKREKIDLKFLLIQKINNSNQTPVQPNVTNLIQLELITEVK